MGAILGQARLGQRADDAPYSRTGRAAGDRADRNGGEPAGRDDRAEARNGDQAKPRKQARRASGRRAMPAPVPVAETSSTSA
jgi:hypothetical protein